jgi:DNA-binding beta-propeller fold protein YncE
MRFEMPQFVSRNIANVPLWPSPPEIPRFAYIGDLMGEQNFAYLQKGNGGFVGFLKTIAGVDKTRMEERLLLQRPQSGAVGQDGKIYVTDVSRQAIFVFDEPAGKLELWDHLGNGETLQSPIGIAVTGTHIYVADSEQGKVFKLGLDGQFVSSFGEETLLRPTGLALNADESEIFVADTEAQCIRVFDPAGNLIRTIGSHGSDSGEFNRPTFLAYSSGKLVVSDSMNARVQIIDEESKINLSIGERGLYIGNMTRPKGVAVDDQGNLYVAESYFDYLLVYNSEGEFLLPIGGTGRGPGEFYQPAGIWVDSYNRIFVADMFNGRIAIFQYLDGD